VFLADGSFGWFGGGPPQEKGSGTSRRSGGHYASTTKSAGGLRVGVGHHEGYYIIATGKVSTNLGDLQQPFYISETTRLRLITKVPKLDSAFSCRSEVI
jgi:hypothetical protein